MDRVMYALVTLVEAALGIFGVRALYEQPAYTVVARLDRGVEIRSYAPRLAVETDARGQGDGDAFGRLFRYITGANRAGDRIAMTAPVWLRNPVRETAQSATGTCRGPTI